MTTHLLIKGRVQGVGYRAGLAQKANELGLHGWVRNLRDGSVEACVQGPQAAVHSLVDWARRGPPFARVEDVEIESSDELIGTDGIFRILPSL